MSQSFTVDYFEKWVNGFKKARDGKRALDEMERKLKHFHPEHFANLKGHVLFACFCAKHYKIEEDPFEIRRKQASDFQKGLTKQIQAIRTIQKFIPRMLTQMLEQMVHDYSRSTYSLHPMP